MSYHYPYYRRYRYRRYGRLSPGSVAGAVVAATILAALTTAAGHHDGGTSQVQPSNQASQAIAFAHSRLGCPYVWGAIGPCTSGYDCSGLVMQAYASAGVTIPRTSQTQWSGLRHVTSPHRGDLVFFAGSDGTVNSPGHVGLVLGPHKMIEAYAVGYPVRVSTFGLPSSPEGDTSPVGFARPAPLTHTATLTAASSYTPASWARAFLRDAGYQRNSCNLAAVTAWQGAEGDWTHGHAGWHNPLNDTRPMPGSRPVNAKHVQAYTSWAQGLDATTATLSGPDYGSIRAALTAGNDAQAVADAVGASVWGTQSFSARC